MGSRVEGNVISAKHVQLSHSCRALFGLDGQWMMDPVFITEVFAGVRAMTHMRIHYSGNYSN